MYNEYFGLSEAPFSIAPDPRYLYMSERHREALAHLLYGLKIDGGFVLLTGEVGTGKTTVCRCLLEQVPDNCDIAFIVNPKLSALELLDTICDELHILKPSSRLSTKVFVDLINFHLLETNARGRKTVLIVDEAQNLSNEVLEQLRLLTNLETNERKLLQIILLGQPELRRRLAEADMRQLAQRIVARYHLDPLSPSEVAAYVGHRLAVAGARHALFPAEVLKRLHRLSKGTPRLINVICDRALLGAYVEGKPAVDRAVLKKAAREALGDGAALPWRRARAWRGWSLVVPALLAFGLGATWLRWGPAEAPAVAPVAADGAGQGAAGPPPQPRASAADAPALSWPAETEHWLHELLAVRALFEAWKLDLPPGDIEAACNRVPELGLHCLRGSGSLEELRGMKTPAILEVRQDGGPDFHATLLALGRERVRLSVAGKPREVDLKVLERQWTGRFATLWSGPTGALREVGLGARGPAVEWVAMRLARWEGGDDTPVPGKLFDAALRERVLGFQRATGLEPDGLAGPLTMARLAAATASGDPVLAPIEGR
jgi:general secretion pathway protein A